MISTTHLSNAFIDVADTLVDNFDVIDFLHNLADHAAAVSGAGAVGILLADHQGVLRFMAASNEPGKLLELLQLQESEGPCLECYRTGAPVINADLASTTDRWPIFSPAALAAGFQSVHAFPMRLRERTIGTLNLFGREHMHFAPDEVRVVQALADVATISILQERTIAVAETLTEQLQSALNSRILIEQAKGAVAQRLGVSVDEAFTAMRSEARSSGMRLVDVAAGLISADNS